MKKQIFLPLLCCLPICLKSQTCPDLTRTGLDFRANDLPFVKIQSDAAPFSVQAFQPHYDGNTLPAVGSFFDLWLGGLTGPGQLRVLHGQPSNAASLFNAGPLDVDGHPFPNCADWSRLWTVARSDIAAHRADFLDNNQIDTPIAAVIGWPGKGNPHFQAVHGFALPTAETDLAPFFDTDGDGVYDPFKGDYPHPAGVVPEAPVARITWGIANGANTGPNLEERLPVTVQQTTWALACTDNDLLHHTLFAAIRITNHGVYPLDSTFIGFAHEFDLGTSSDDAVGHEANLATAYVYNRLNFDTSSLAGQIGFGENPPVFSFTLLNKPLHGGIHYFNTSGTLLVPGYMGDPKQPLHYYSYLNARWLNNTVMRGCNGQPTKIIWPDNPNLTGGCSVYRQVAPDKPWSAGARTLSSVYMGRLGPGESQRIDVAYAYHRQPGADHLGNIDFMLGRVAQLRQAYATGLAGVPCAAPLCLDGVACVWPADADRNGIVNQEDLLPLGLGWGATGPARQDLALDWSPQNASEWGVSAMPAVDLKDVDFNGSGHIDAEDFTVFRDFYGLSNRHYKPQPPVYVSGDGIKTVLIPTSTKPDSVVAPFQIVVRLNGVQGISGIALEAAYDPAYWETAQLTLQFVNKENLSVLDRKEGLLRFAYVTKLKTDTLSPNTFLFFLPLKPKRLAAGMLDSTCVLIRNIKAVDVNGRALQVGADPLCFRFRGGLVSGAHDLPSRVQPTLLAFPNPADQTLYLESDAMVLRAQLLDAQGRPCWEAQRFAQASISLQTLPEGFYFLETTWEGVRRIQKIIVLH